MASPARTNVRQDGGASGLALHHLAPYSPRTGAGTPQPQRLMRSATAAKTTRRSSTTCQVQAPPEVTSADIGYTSALGGSPIRTRGAPPRPRAKFSQDRALDTQFSSNFSSPIAAKVAWDFACAMEKATCGDAGTVVPPKLSMPSRTDAGTGRSFTPRSFSKGISSPRTESTRLSSAGTQLSCTEPALSITRLSSAGTQRSDEYDDVGGPLASVLRPRKLYPEVLVQTKELCQLVPEGDHVTPLVMGKFEGSMPFEAESADSNSNVEAESADTGTEASPSNAMSSNAMQSATLIIREQAECIERSQSKLTSQMTRIDKLLQDVERSRELQVACSPYRQRSATTFPDTGRSYPCEARVLSVTEGARWRMRVASPSARARGESCYWPLARKQADVDSSKMSVGSGRESTSLTEQELKMEGAKSHLTQAVAEAQNVRATQARDISILTAARDQLLSEMEHAKVQGLPDEDLRPAELQRRQLHNAIQDLKGQVRVFCRMRPMNNMEQMSGDEYMLRVLDDDCVECPRAGVFYFNGVFAPGTQEEIFEGCKDLAQSAVDGHNVTIFSYGQTGAGKTFTMYGMPEAEGLAGRMVKELFGILDGLQDCETVSVEGSMAEIYNSSIIDLLKHVNMQEDSVGRQSSFNGTNRQHGFNGSTSNGVSRQSSKETSTSVLRQLNKEWGTGAVRQSSKEKEVRPKLRQGKEGTFQVDDLTTWQVSNSQELKDLIEHGFAQRSVAETALNTCSSRSHLIFTVKLTRTNKSGETLTGKLVFCDLGGSERLKKTEAVGDRKKEAIEINKSLAALCDVIQAVADKRNHVPYRNHALTRILQDSLGGTAKTLMFVHCSPASSCAGETAMSLKFAARAGRIVNDSALQHYNRSQSV